MEEFLSHWHSQEFEDLLRRMVEITKPKRFERNLTLDVDANVMIKEDRGSAEPFDGIIEFWWDKGSHLLDLYETDEAKRIRQAMKDYQSRFVDLAASSAFFTTSGVL